MKKRILAIVVSLNCTLNWRVRETLQQYLYFSSSQNVGVNTKIVETSEIPVYSRHQLDWQVQVDGIQFSLLPYYIMTWFVGDALHGLTLFYVICTLI